MLTELRFILADEVPESWAEDGFIYDLRRAVIMGSAVIAVYGLRGLTNATNGPITTGKETGEAIANRGRQGGQKLFRRNGSRRRIQRSVFRR